MLCCFPCVLLKDLSCMLLQNVFQNKSSADKPGLSVVILAYQEIVIHACNKRVNLFHDVNSQSSNLIFSTYHLQLFDHG